MSPAQIPLGAYLLLLDLVLVLLPLRDQRGEHQRRKGAATCVWKLRERVEAEVKQHRRTEHVRAQRRLNPVWPLPEWCGQLYRGRHRLPARIEDPQLAQLSATSLRGLGCTWLPRGIHVARH